jgi:hypothetical protein
MLISRFVKIRGWNAENFPVRHSSGARSPVFRKVYVPNSQKRSTTTATVEPDRLRLIVKRLQDRFYDTEPASVQIATAVFADIKDLDESRSALPH